MLEVAALTAVITDVHYRMSLAAIRDLADAGVRVVACEKEEYRNRALGFCSNRISAVEVLPDSGWFEALYSLCEALCREEGEKPALLPVGAKTLAALAEPDARARFSRVCGLCLPTAGQLDLFNDKAAVSRLAERLGIPVPCSFAVDGLPGENMLREIPLPCVVKPLCGEKFGLPASERYVIARDSAALETAVAHFRKLTGEAPVVQEYLCGMGMGCSVIAEKGEILSAVCHRRLREYPISGGPSTCCVSFSSEPLLEYARRMMEETGYSGLAMLEFKEDAAGIPRLLEINPRVWGSYPLTRAAKTGLSYVWFAAAWRNGNPGQELPPVSFRPIDGKKMVFSASDAAAALGYWKHGKKRQALRALGDFLNPAVRDGLWEWRDPKPGLRYLKTALKKD